MHNNQLTLNCEGLCGVQEGQELVLRNVHLPFIDVVNDCLEVVEGNILQEYNCLLVCLLTKETLQLIQKHNY